MGCAPEGSLRVEKSLSRGPSVASCHQLAALMQLPNPAKHRTRSSSLSNIGSLSTGGHPDFFQHYYVSFLDIEHVLGTVSATMTTILSRASGDTPLDPPLDNPFTQESGNSKLKGGVTLHVD